MIKLFLLIAVIIGILRFIVWCLENPAGYTKDKQPNPQYSHGFWRKHKEEGHDDNLNYPGSPPA